MIAAESVTCAVARAWVRTGVPMCTGAIARRLAAHRRARKRCAGRAACRGDADKGRRAEEESTPPPPAEPQPQAQQTPVDSTLLQQGAADREQRPDARPHCECSKTRRSSCSPLSSSSSLLLSPSSSTSSLPPCRAPSSRSMTDLTSCSSRCLTLLGFGEEEEAERLPPPVLLP